MTTPLRTRIINWLDRHDREFAAQAQRERDQVLPDDRRIPADVMEMFAKYDEDIHKRNQLPVGMLFDFIRDQPTANTLLIVAEIGEQLFGAAILAADENDNTEFFAEAYGQWGPLVDAVLEECGLDYRDTLTGHRRRQLGS